ncbi:MAG: TIGR03749 family integrating conjugative element protein [Parvibaculaceae bacterium]
MSQAVWAIQTVSWDKTVIELELTVGVEQMVQFEGAADVGVSGAMASGDVFRHMFLGNTAYWTALQPFKKHRVQIRLHDTGEFVLFDVSAVTRQKPPRNVEPLRVVTGSVSTVPEQAVGNSQPAKSERQSATMFDLIRYAAQVDHSPQRVVEPVTGVRHLDVLVKSELSRLYNHPDATKVDMFVVNGWSGADLYVTTIEIHNRTAEPIEIDPSRLQHTARQPMNGASHHFIASAMIRPTLAPRGQTGDRTRVYIVTDKPFSSVVDL